MLLNEVFDPSLKEYFNEQFAESTGTIQRLVEPEQGGVGGSGQNSFGQAQDTYGAPDDDYEDDPALVDIPCQVTAQTASQGNEEMRRADQTIVQHGYTVAFFGYYPTITEACRLVLTSPRQETHNILRVTHDGDVFTTLSTEIVNGN